MEKDTLLKELKGFDQALKQVRESVTTYVINLLRRNPKEPSAIHLLTKLEELEEFFLQINASSRIREVLLLLDNGTGTRTRSKVKGRRSEFIVPEVEEDELRTLVKTEPVELGEEILPFVLDPLDDDQLYDKNNDEWVPSPAANDDNGPLSDIEYNPSGKRNSYPCETCGDKVYASSSGLREHQRRNHPEDWEKRRKRRVQISKFKKGKLGKGPQEIDSISEKPVGDFKCSKCEKTYFFPFGLYTHRKKAHPGEDFRDAREQKCSVCKETFPNVSSLNLHLHSIHPEEYEKKIRKWRGQRKTMYKIHSNKVKNEENCEGGDNVATINPNPGRPGNFKCSKCGNTYVYRTGLYAHRRQVHPGEELEGFKKVVLEKDCPVCKETFPNNANLTSHLRSAHSEERPYLCPVSGCDARFLLQKHLDCHGVTHQSDRPSFVRKSIQGNIF